MASTSCFAQAFLACEAIPFGVGSQDTAARCLFLVLVVINMLSVTVLMQWFPVQLSRGIFVVLTLADIKVEYFELKHFILL